MSRAALRRIRRASKVAFARLDSRALRLAARSQVGAALYYAARPSFRREMHALAAGRVRHLSPAASHHAYRLRRNVHRLEKGLISRPRRSLFAEGYIDDTVATFGSLVADPQAPEYVQDIVWADHVLSEYFRVVDPDWSRGKDLRDRFQTFRTSATTLCDTATECSTEGVGRPAVPYEAAAKHVHSVTLDDFVALSRARRSVRWFEERPVPRDLLDQALMAGAQAPSACNRQPYRFLVVDDRDAAAEIAGYAMGTAGFAHNFPTLVVVVGDQSAYKEDRDRHLIYIDASLAAMGAMYAIEAAGASTCAINWPDIESRERRMSRRLGLHPYERVVMLMAVGYADPRGLVPFSAKRPVGQVRAYLDVSGAEGGGEKT